MDSSGRLVVDDDPAVRAKLLEYLGGHGYEVRAVDGGAAMRAEIERDLPDVILLEIRMPGEDGLTVARFLRERYDVGIITVTTSSDVVDRVVGLEIGADDYVAQPFDPRELLARVKRVLRRIQARDALGGSADAARDAPASTSNARVRCGRGLLDVDARRLCEANGDELAITAMQYELLRGFPASPNRVLSRDQLLMQTRNRQREPFDRSINIRIGRLRKKIEPDPSGEPRCIRTLRNAGYM